jgi:uncharacterized protein YggE
MRSRLLVSLVGLALALGLLALLPRPAPVAAQQQSTGISVVGEGRVVATPDVARVVFGVERQEAALQPALAAAAAAMDSVIGRLTQLGVAREDIQTIRFSVQPVYDNRGGSQVLRGYRVSNAVQARLKRLDQVGTTIDEVVAAGANQVEGISFETSRLPELKAQARELAVGNARDKAEQLARVSGVGLGRVASIEESDASGGPVERAPQAMAAAAAPSTPVEGGQLEIRTIVHIRWDIS